jgi:hypothetical protein
MQRTQTIGFGCRRNLTEIYVDAVELLEDHGLNKK